MKVKYKMLTYLMSHPKTRIFLIDQQSTTKNKNTFILLTLDTRSWRRRMKSNLTTIWAYGYYR
jgi:hypothetical protein